MRAGRQKKRVVDGEVRRRRARRFLGNARLTVVPSVWFETVGIVDIDASLLVRPLIGPRICALSDIVDDGITGPHVAPGDAADFIEKVRIFWIQPERFLTLGIAARKKAVQECGSERVLDRFMECYEGAHSDAQAKRVLPANA